MELMPGEQRELDSLRWHWGEVYRFSFDGEYWHADRRAGGGRMSAYSPERLRLMVRADYLRQADARRRLQLATGSGNEG